MREHKTAKTEQSFLGASRLELTRLDNESLEGDKIDVCSQSDVSESISLDPATKISYPDMMQELARTHVRRTLTSRTKRKFPVCGTSLGWLCCKMKQGSLEQDVAGEVGIAVILYFKQLKCILVLLFILALMSIPQFVILIANIDYTSAFDPYELNVGLLS